MNVVASTSDWFLTTRLNGQVVDDDGWGLYWLQCGFLVARVVKTYNDR